MPEFIESSIFLNPISNECKRDVKKMSVTCKLWKDNYLNKIIKCSYKKQTFYNYKQNYKNVK